MEHSVTTELILAVAEARGRSGHQQKTRRLDRSTRHDDEPAPLHAGAWVVRIGNVQVAYTGCASCLSIVDDFVRFRIGVDLGVGQVAKFLDRGNPTAGLRTFLAPAQI